MIVPRVVFDTNCLVSALIFKGVMSQRFRSMWQHTQVLPVICPETEAELRAVLAYPKFSLRPDMQQILLNDFLGYAEYFPSIKPIEEIPDLIDPKDTMFVRLAQKSQTGFLVSGDRHILALESKFPKLHITTPAEFIAAIGI